MGGEARLEDEPPKGRGIPRVLSTIRWLAEEGAHGCSNLMWPPNLTVVLLLLLRGVSVTGSTGVASPHCIGTCLVGHSIAFFPHSFRAPTRHSLPRNQVGVRQLPAQELLPGDRLVTLSGRALLPVFLLRARILFVPLPLVPSLVCARTRGSSARQHAKHKESEEEEKKTCHLLQDSLGCHSFMNLLHQPATELARHL